MSFLMRATLVALVVAFLPSTLHATPLLGPPQVEDAVSFELVGHDPLYARGMNAAPAMYDHYLYIGSRTDGQAQHIHPGVLVVDVADPSDPTVVGEIGLPFEGLPKSTSRELRVWPEQKLLMVLNFDCSAILHACLSPADAAGAIEKNIRFFDLTDPVNPQQVAVYTPARTPHEFFLWVDPVNEGRALLYYTTPSSSSSATTPNLVVVDISRARENVFTQLAAWNPNTLFPLTATAVDDVRLHSLGLSNDGTRGYLAYLGGGFLVVDTSQATDPANTAPVISAITDVAERPHWGDPGAHSAVKLSGRPYVLVTDEVYGDLIDPITGADHGCPWGWVRMVDVSDEIAPAVVGEFRVAENDPAYCAGEKGQDPLNTYFTSYSAHNPTIVGDVAFVTWHSSGLRAIDVSDPTTPAELGRYVPEPLALVVTEDPALSMGKNKVVMWSYPIVKDGLVYVVDVRNGLYVLRYTGPGAEAIDAVGFLEGNSNLGDAFRLPP